MDPLSLRRATAADAASVLAIYKPYVTDSAASFEEQVPTIEEMAARIERCIEKWAWLVATMGDELLGYAYGTAHRAREGYRFSVETSVYLAPSAQGKGLGKKLYSDLFEVLIEKGYCNAYAGIVVPNDGSIALHRAVGFSPIGVFPRVGYKFGVWQDVSWWHKALREGPAQ